MPKTREQTVKAMDLLLSRGIINKEAKLNDLVAISRDLADLGGPDIGEKWTCIGPHYIYTGDDPVRANAK